MGFIPNDIKVKLLGYGYLILLIASYTARYYTNGFEVFDTAIFTLYILVAISISYNVFKLRTFFNNIFSF